MPCLQNCGLLITCAQTEKELQSGGEVKELQTKVDELSKE